MHAPVIHPVVDEGLGNSAYLLDLGDGSGLAVDASRDLRGLRDVADRFGLSIRFAADTHLHADFLSGATQLAATDGATVLASASGHRDFSHRGLGDGDEVDLGGLTLRSLATPGHTHEHLAFELLDGSRVLGVFTGGSLLVGSAARTDLVSPERTEELARAQYRSLKRLAELGDDVSVWPTHGAGSFCSSPPGVERTSTIGTERTSNPLLRAGSEDVFVEELLGSLGTFPAYFMRLGEINRRGPDLVTDQALPSLSAAEVHGMMAKGAEVVDVRPTDDFAAGHVAGSVSIPLRAAFATWLGWLIAPDQPIVVVRNPDQDGEEILWQSLKIGYDQTVGELAGGVDAWTAARYPSATLPLLHADQLADAQVLDVRQDDEYDAGHVPGAVHVELGDLVRRLHELPTGPLVVMCGHGERAMSAGSLLQRAGHAELAVLRGGPDEWSAATGEALESAR